MNNPIKFSIDKSDTEKRLDVFLSEKITHLTRSFIKKTIDKGNVSINDKVIKLASKKIKENDNVSVKLINEKIKEIKASKIKLNIKFEDENILIINKPSGMVVHPGAGNH